MSAIKEYYHDVIEKEMKKPVKILLFFAVWQRPEILQICCEGVKRLCSYKPEKFDITPFAVASPDDPAIQVLEKYEIPFTLAPNDFLGKKKNIGLKTALENVSFDFMLEMGSDDLISNKLLDLYEHLFAEEKLCWGPDSCYFVNAENGQIAKWKTDLVIGAGRVVHRSVIEKLIQHEFIFTQSIAGIDFDYHPRQIAYFSDAVCKSYEKWEYGHATGNIVFQFWSDARQRGLDTNSLENMRRVGVDHDLVTLTEPLIVDIKSDVNLNQFSKFTPCAATLPDITKYFGKQETTILAKMCGLNKENHQSSIINNKSKSANGRKR